MKKSTMPSQIRAAFLMGGRFAQSYEVFAYMVYKILTIRYI